MNEAKQKPLLIWLRKSTTKILGAVVVIPFTAGAAYIFNKYVLNPPRPHIVSVQTRGFRFPMTLDNKVGQLLKNDPSLSEDVETQIANISDLECRDGLQIRETGEVILKDPCGM